MSTLTCVCYVSSGLECMKTYWCALCSLQTHEDISRWVLCAKYMETLTSLFYVLQQVHQSIDWRASSVKANAWRHWLECSISNKCWKTFAGVVFFVRDSKSMKTFTGGFQVWQQMHEDIDRCVLGVSRCMQTFMYFMCYDTKHEDIDWSVLRIAANAWGHRWTGEVAGWVHAEEQGTGWLASILLSSPSSHLPVFALNVHWDQTIWSRVPWRWNSA